MSIEVIQPYKPQPIQFASPDEFNMYYNKHADEFNETTYKLNVKYKIPGFKITKLKGELKLIKDYSIPRSSASLPHATLTDDVEQRFKSLEARIDRLQHEVANVVSYLQELNA